MSKTNLINNLMKITFLLSKKEIFATFQMKMNKYAYQQADEKHLKVQKLLINVFRC